MARALPLALVKREGNFPSESIASPGTTLCVPSWDGVEELWPCNRLLGGSIAATSVPVSSKSGGGRGFISSSIHLPSSMWPQRKPQSRRRLRSSSDKLLPPKTSGSKQRAHTSVLKSSLFL